MKRMFLIELSVMTVLVLLCMFRSFRSKKELGRPTAYVLLAIVVPLMGNIIITSSTDPVICNAGYNMYLLGTNLVIFTLIDFSLKYCFFPPLKRISWCLIIAALTGDSISVFLNNVFQHCYMLEETALDTGEIYVVLKSGPGHYIHLALSAVLLTMIAGNYIYRIFTSAVLYLERYLVILLSIVVVGLFEYRNVLLDRTVDRSMVGLALGGMLLYFFALEYKPILLKMTLHDLLVANLTDAVLFFDQYGKAIYANRSAASMFHITRDNLDRSAELLGEEITGREFIENHMRVDRDFRFQTMVGEGENRKYYDVTCQRMEDRRGNYLGAFFGIEDNTLEEKERRESLFRQTHDELTGIMNKESFIDQVNQRLAVDPDGEYVMILTDISDFKIVNDIYGRETADKILKEIADAYRRLVHKDTTYCRWGGDWFAAFAKKDDISPQLLEREIRQSVEEGNRESGFMLPVRIHAGYYVIRGRGIPVSSMVDRCIMAVAQVHDDYQRVVGVYDDNLRQKRLWEQRISAELPAAIEEKQIFPYLQPQYDSRQLLTGAEVLVRWQHPREGFLAPNRFIPVFERNGMITQVDIYIWEEACRILAAWRGTGKEKLHLSVNISPKDFYFIDLYETFTKLVEKYQLDPGKLHLEVTETVVMQDAAENIRTIKRLREYGFIVEMDDFGSGYSSLNLLRDLPVDVLKIDMAFLGKTAHPQKAEAILNSIIALARQLNMLSIAEGVEAREQLQMLTQMGCSIFQGYYFAKPMPVEDFEKLTA